MSRYEERLQNDLDALRERVVGATRYAEKAVAQATTALLAGDHQAAWATALGDLPLNRDVREIDRLCHAFIARHLPGAGHLRFVSSVLRVNIAVERIGDYAVTIARESVQLSAPPPAEIAVDLAAMSAQATAMLAQTADAFEQGDPQLARGTLAMAGQVDTTFDAVFFDLLETGDEARRPLRDLLALFAVFNRLERVSDQAKNICEQIVFAATGETKDPKVYRVLFVDERNDRLSLMAQAIAGKAFPRSCTYASAGWDPATAVEPGLEAFMNARGHSIEGVVPASIAAHREFLADAHVVVSLAGDPRPHLPAIPFHTAVQIWDVTAIPKGLDRDREDALLERAFKELSLLIADLLETLQGDGAD